MPGGQQGRRRGVQQCAGTAVTGSTLEKITEREQAVAAGAETARTQIEQLTGRLREMEAEPAELATARKVVLALDQNEDETMRTTGLPENPVHQHILAILADAGELRHACDQCTALDLGIEPKSVEGMRSKLKRLVAHGLLIEPEPGLFILHHQ